MSNTEQFNDYISWCYRIGCRADNPSSLRLYADLAGIPKTRHRINDQRVYKMEIDLEVKSMNCPNCECNMEEATAGAWACLSCGYQEKR